MKYAFKLETSIVVDVEKVKKDTTITHAEYGDILITKGNYILTKPDGSQVGITATDLELQYKPVK